MITNPLTWEQLFEILLHTENGVDDILSTKSNDYVSLKEQGVDFEEITLTELHKLVEQYPKLIRSPITVTNGMTMVGYMEDEITTLMDRKAKKESYLKTLNTVRAEDKEIEKIKHSKYDRVSLAQ